MSVPPAPQPPGARYSRHPIVTALLVVVGIILLLPGLCTVYFVGGFVLTDGLSTLLHMAGGDPGAGLFFITWIVSLVISLFGVWLLRRAWLRR